MYAEENMAQNTRRNTQNNPFININLNRIEGYSEDEVRERLYARFDELLDEENMYADTVADAKAEKNEIENEILNGEASENASLHDLREKEIQKERYNRIQRGKSLAEMNSWEDKLHMFDDNPEVFAKLYSIQESSLTDIKNEGTREEPRDVETNRSKIMKDENGDLYLAVEMLKPSEFSFKIYDGKLEFSTDGMSPDKMKEMIDYLERRGLASAIDYGAIKAPKGKEEEVESQLLSINNADKETEEMFNEVLDEKKEEYLANGGGEIVIGVSGDISGAPEENKNDDQQNDNNSEDEEENEQEGDTTEEKNEDEERDNEYEPLTDSEREEHGADISEATANGAVAKNANANSSQAYSDAVASLRKWAHKNKRKNLTFFETYENGYFVITTFEKESIDNMKHDGVIDKKTGELKSKFGCKFYVKVNEKGKLEVNMAVPAGKKLTLDEVDRVTDAFDDAGINPVLFKGYTDEQEAVIRAGCGKALIDPVGLKLTKSRIDVMLDEAGKKHGKNTPKVMEYKYKLAKRLAGQLMDKKKKNAYDPDNKNDSDCRAVRHLTLEYKCAPFRDLWEDFNLRDDYESILNKSATRSGNRDGAAQMAGAGFAVNRLYNLYKESVMPGNWWGEPLSINETLGKTKLLSKSEIEEFRQRLAEKGCDGTEKFKDMHPTLKRHLFGIIHQTESDNARYRINDEFNRMSKSSTYNSESKERQAIRLIVDNAKTSLQEVREDLKDMNLPDIYIAPLTTPDHDFTRPSNREIDNEKRYGTGNRFGPGTARTEPETNTPPQVPQRPIGGRP